MRKNLRTLVRVAAIIVMAAGSCACSTMSDLNPFGGSDNTAIDSQGYPIPAPQADNGAAPADTAATTTATDNSATTADNAAYPSVASVPDKPKPTTTPQERTEISHTLVADRSRAQYSADALRGGTEPAAAPPPPAPPQADLASVEPAPDTSTDTASSDNSGDSSAAAPSSDSGISSAVAPAPAASSSSQSSELSAATEPAPAPAPSTKVASLTPPSAPVAATAPAVSSAHAASAIPGAEPAIPADAPLAFNPSTAPPLDSSVSQFVPELVLARYQATQAEAKGLSSPTATRKVKVTPAQAVRPANGNQSSNDSGGVLVNMDAIGASPGVVKTSASSGAVAPASWSVPGRTPTGVVFFGATGSGINAAGEAQIRAAAQAYKARGTGYVRVVGHAASRTGNMPLNQHIAYVFKQSQQHATAVAQALIKAGVPANAVIVEAVGDTQPVYYELMPQGEDGNRRTEIFIEG